MPSYDIIVELNTDQKTDLNYLHKVGYEKAAWYIGTIWIDGEKFNELNSLCESLQKRNEIEPFFKKIYNRWWKVDQYNNLWSKLH